MMVSEMVNSVDSPYQMIILFLEEQKDEIFPNISGINCNDYIIVHNNKLAAIHNRNSQ